MRDTEKVNILLVDDQPAKLLSYEVILQDLNENLMKARSGAEALETLLKQEIAVVLVDVCMPQLDGFELAAMIRDHPRFQKIAIIFISAIHLSDMDRLRGYEMGAVDYVPVPVVPEVLRAKVKVFAELYRKTRQLESLNRELEDRVAERTAQLEASAAKLRESEHRRTLALAAGQMGSWDWDLKTGDVLWDAGQYRIFGVKPDAFEITPQSLQSLIDPEDWDSLYCAWKSMLVAPEVKEIEFRINRPDGGRRWCLGTAAVSLDAKGDVIRISGVTVDITERKKAEERQTFLAREVDHRARNVLAIVQSIMRLTKAPTAQDYVEAVEGRIRSLSRAHSLLSESRWEGADLRRLVDEELAPYLNEGTARIQQTDSDEIFLLPKPAQTLAMVLHELATNAAKYGALSPQSPGGISLGWGMEDASLVIRWIETGVANARKATSQGYGMRLIEASLQQIGGDAHFDWSSNGLNVTLRLSASENLSQRANQTRREGLAGIVANILKGNKVLVVEDEPLVSLMMSEALNELGFEVIGPFRKVSEAVAALNKTTVHAAILDVNLGDQQVYPVAELLQGRDIPFAFVTGYGAESIDKEYRHVAVLQKPVDRRMLEQVFFVKGVGCRAPGASEGHSSSIFGKSRTAYN
jgi:PAS domain S-box-containing protein